MICRTSLAATATAAVLIGMSGCAKSGAERTTAENLTPKVARRSRLMARLDIGHRTYQCAVRTIQS